MPGKKNIKIYDNKTNQINPVFIRANGIILEKFMHLVDRSPTVQSKNKLLRDLWKKEYNASLVQDRKLKIYKQIKFQNSMDYMMFLMKLSG